VHRPYSLLDVDGWRFREAEGSLTPPWSGPPDIDVRQARRTAGATPGGSRALGAVTLYWH